MLIPLQDPARRPTSHQLLTHPWLSGEAVADSGSTVVDGSCASAAAEAMQTSVETVCSSVESGKVIKVGLVGFVKSNSLSGQPCQCGVLAS